MNNQQQPGFLIGAYASMPEDAAAYYQALAEIPWVSGLEVPFFQEFQPSAEWLAPRLASWDESIITPIPGVMGRKAQNPEFGIASQSAEGRKAGVAFVDRIFQQVKALQDASGKQLFSLLSLHTAPTRTHSADNLRRSMDEILSGDTCGLQLQFEHCDAWTDAHPVEKGFLPLADEVTVAKEFEVGVAINWGRSVIETRSATTPLEHIRVASEAGVLSGVMYSGASGEDNIYGGAWIDCHPPAQIDEPASLMTAANIARCTATALESPGLKYLGAKVCVPPSASIEQRVEILTHIYEACRG